jgi:cytochrome c553
MPSPMTRSFVRGWGVALLALGLACDDPAPDLAEWTLADHTHQSEKSQPKRRGGIVNKPATYTPPAPNRNPLVDVTWAKQCANCHGKKGRGDGPQSPMVQAKDLTSIEWQATVSDEQLSQSIKKGKGKMPAFNLPESMVADLVTHIRTLPQKAKKGFPQGTAPAAGGAAPSAAAPAPGAPAAASAPAAAAAAPAAPAPAAPAPVAAPADEDDEAENENAH